jgi:pimeloyl-ACP methyl ester carboxylesterase
MVASANARTASAKPVLVFVHGFGSDETCWGRLLELLSGDPEITSRYEFERFPYPTEWLELKPWQRLPSLREAADKLKNFLDSERFRDRSLTLIGHSQGGLVIHAYIARLLEDGEGRRLEPVRQVITLATPHLGSTFLSGPRRLFYRFVDNAQERGLRALDPDTARIVGIVEQRAADAAVAGGSSWPIPVSCFGGLRDNIVLPASAQGPFASYKSISGNHSTILQPKDTEDDRYSELAEVLLDPGGHPHVFEVEQYTTRIAPRPVPLQTFRIRLGEDSYREVVTDNVCELDRGVRFARSNQCQAQFKIRYRAFGGSCFVANPSHRNEAGQLAGEYESGGDNLDFLFTPELEKPEVEYALPLTIYNGFGEGRRDVHFHFGTLSMGGMAFYRKLTYELDLSAYLDAGSAVTVTPTLYWHPTDRPCKECKGLRAHHERVAPVAENERGVWRWELENMREGVADLLWNVAARAR